MLSNKLWWRAAGIRAIKTVAQTAVATIGSSLVLSQVDWLAVASASILAGVLSMLTSIAGLPEVVAESKEVKGEIIPEDEPTLEDILAEDTADE